MSMANRTSVNYTNSFTFYFNISTAVILTIVGFIGNSLVLFILTRKQFRNVSMFRYHSLLVTFETLQMISIWILNFPNIFLLNENTIACKLIQYVSKVVASSVTWFGPIISIDRFISVKCPNNFLIRNKVKFQVTIIACLIFGSSIKSIPFYYFYNLYSINNTTQCVFTESSSTKMLLDILLHVLSLCFSFSISIISNCLTSYQLIHRRKRLNIKIFKKEKRLYKILISMDVFFFICYSPWCVYTILNDTFTAKNYFPSSMTIFFNIANFMFYLYQSFSFVVYFLSNKQFRSFFAKKNS